MRRLRVVREEAAVRVVRQWCRLPSIGLIGVPSASSWHWYWRSPLCCSGPGPATEKTQGAAQRCSRRSIRLALTRGLVSSASYFRRLVQMLVMPAFGVLDWVDWIGISTVLLLVVPLALLWLSWHRDRD